MSELRILDIEQRSPEWYAARCGIVTASAVGKLITPRTVKPASNDESRGLIALLASERVTGIVEDTYTNHDMMRGILAEPYARDLYNRHYAQGEEAVECGFMVRQFDGFEIGFSPDGLVGDDGLIEIKSPRAKTHLQTILSGAVPLHYVAQLQAGLLVSGREWADFVSYCGGMPLWRKRVGLDPRWKDAILKATKQAEVAIAEAVELYELSIKGLPATERVDYYEDVVI